MNILQTVCYCARTNPCRGDVGVADIGQRTFDVLGGAAVVDSHHGDSAPGTIPPKRSGKAHSFKECLARGMGHLDENEAVVAASIDAHRDGVQHQGAAVTEERLYMDAASCLRLFDRAVPAAA